MADDIIDLLITLSARMSSLEARFGALEARFSAVEARIGGIEESINGIGLLLKYHGELLVDVARKLDA